MINIYFSGSQKEDGTFNTAAYIYYPEEISSIYFKSIKYDFRVGVSYVSLELVLNYLLENNLTHGLRIYNHDMNLIKNISEIKSINIKSDALMNIKDMLNFFSDIEFTLIEREQNLKAIYLAKVGKESI